MYVPGLPGSLCYFSIPSRVLLTYVAEALDAVEPIDERVFDALASPGSSVPGSVAPLLGSALASMSSPLVLVLDDVHVLHNSECRAALSVLADHMPRGSRLVLAGRAEPPLRVTRLRAEGKILEIGPDELSLTRNESSSLLRDAGVALGEDEIAELYRRTEGWAAGLYLAAFYLREGSPLTSAVVSFGGDDRLVSEYLESEFLARVPPQQRAFLTQTAVLERLCGPLCDAVLEHDGSAAVLADLARSNLLLVPLDRGEWYRYHHLFRDMLLAELHRLEPGLMPVLRRRAATWCLRNDLPEEALEYFIAAGDTDAAAGLAGILIRPGLPAGPGHHGPAVAAVAGKPGRDRGTPAARRAGRAPVRVDGPAGRRRTAGRCDRSLAIRGRRAVRGPPLLRRGPPAPRPAVPERGRADARRCRRGRPHVRGAKHRGPGTLAPAGNRAGPVR